MSARICAIILEKVIWCETINPIQTVRVGGGRGGGGWASEARLNFEAV